MNQNKKKVVIVDDHPLFRERLAQLINYEPDMEVTGEAENTKDAIQLIRNTSPDLATVNISLKGSSGLELIKSIKPISIGLRVLVLSMHEESLYAERALRAGASGYITKHQGADEVLLAIRRVLAGVVNQHVQHLDDRGGVDQGIGQSVGHVHDDRKVDKVLRGYGDGSTRERGAPRPEWIRPASERGRSIVTQGDPLTLHRDGDG